MWRRLRRGHMIVTLVQSLVESLACCVAMRCVAEETINVHASVCELGRAPGHGPGHALARQTLANLYAGASPGASPGTSPGTSPPCDRALLLHGHAWEGPICSVPLFDATQRCSFCVGLCGMG